MKKIVSIVLLLIMLCILLTGCGVSEIKSLDRYKEWVSETTFGFSEVEIDHPKWFLPSYTFLDDYIYIEGNFYYYSTEDLHFLIDKDFMPDRSLLTLKYEADIYLQAKQCVLNNIPVYENKYYNYGNYQFYVNKNFMDTFDYTAPARPIPEWCTMVCYNDENNTIGFLGFYKSSYHQLPEKYINDLENNWTSFIDEYYGEYYDFSK